MKAWLNKLMGRPAPVNLAERLGDDAHLVLIKKGLAYDLPLPPHKTGEQTGKMVDPLGKRIYHEHFTEVRPDGKWDWRARIYDRDGLRAEKTGIADDKDRANTAAIEAANAVKTMIGSQP